VDASGNPESWIHDIVVQPVLSSAFAVEGAATSFYYAIANRRVSWTDPRQGVPVFTWRSVGASHNAFVVESFLDELAALGGRDPLELRLALLAGDGSADAMRIAAALQDVALRSGWATPPAAGRGRGIACHQTFGSIVAQVVEASVEDGQVRVHKVWTTVDCGLAVNPRGIEAQVEGSICFGLSAALFGEITLANGGAVQTNFDAYPLLRMADAPECDVSIINSGAAMTGMGEPAVPPVAPALCNAIFQATGQRIRRLPIRLA
jgi:isoquinoline 1-oxidoreductase beta subunit